MKVVKLRQSGVKARIMVLPKSEIVYLAGFIVADSSKSYQSQVIYCFCDNYLTDVIPAVIGKDKSFRASVFDELFKAISEYNPEIEKSWRPIAGNPERGGTIPIMMIKNINTETEKTPKTKKGTKPITKEKVCTIFDSVTKVVFGQEEVIRKIQEHFECSLVGLGEPDKPRGSFIFVGDTGCGKTLVVKEIAKHFWGSEWRTGLFTINGSELGEEHETAKLLGSPPGYVGFDEGSALLKHVVKNPESIILVDEFEKAHPRMQDVFLQILDEGACHDNKGNRVDFSKTFIVFTSNIGTKEVYHKNTLGFQENMVGKNVDVYVTSALHKFCRVEFLKRFNAIVVFNSLVSSDYYNICKAEVSYLLDRIDTKLATVTVEPGVYGLLVEKMTKGETSRDLKSLVKQYIEIPIARELVRNSVKGTVVVSVLGSEIVVGRGDCGKTEKEGCQ
jgi:ATP-dependent Clp protease ATP-binding subunit ClpA